MGLGHLEIMRRLEEANSLRAQLNQSTKLIEQQGEEIKRLKAELAASKDPQYHDVDEFYSNHPEIPDSSEDR